MSIQIKIENGFEEHIKGQVEEQIEREEFNDKVLGGNINPLNYRDHYEWTISRSSLNIYSEESQRLLYLMSTFFNIYHTTVRQSVLDKYLIQSLSLNKQGIEFGSLPHKLFSLVFIFRYLYNPGDLPVHI